VEEGDWWGGVFTLSREERFDTLLIGRMWMIFKKVAEIFMGNLQSMMW